MDNLLNERYGFSTDVNQLLNLIINAVYSNKDIFIRELISNASDALNKARYECLLNPNYLDNNTNLEIKISFDNENKVLIISDTGIGMTKKDLIHNLGTIANSGTKKYLESLTNKDLNLIGQFGIGFYSGFLVANKIIVSSKHNDENKAFTWESSGDSCFTIYKCEDELIRGTVIKLYLKEDSYEYLDETNLKNIINKHNQFIDFPIYVYSKLSKEILKYDDDGNKLESEIEIYYDYDLLNKNKPIWLRNSKDITEDEYNSFYKSLTGDYDSCLDYLHFTMEGNVEAKGLIYIPKRLDNELLNGNNKKRGLIKLYSRKVFIMDDFTELIPDYMKFIHVVIETDDIPLTLSRETLQSSKTLKLISKNIVKKVIELFNTISNNSDKFRIFYEQYSKFIKFGIHEDSTNRNKLVSLLRYETTNSNEDLISFDDYVQNMNENQKYIYYIGGESIQILKNSPFLEKFRNKNYEVIYMYEPLDEYVTQHIKDYKEKQLICITKENIDFNDDNNEKQEYDRLKEEYKNLCEYIKTVLNDKVEKVVVSNKLVDSPCILSTVDYGLTANMQRIMKAQTFGRPEINYVMNKKILEINPNNNIIQKLRNKLNNQNDKLKELTVLLYEITLQSSGFTVEDPSLFSNRVLNLIDSDLSN